ncbi:GNAT family N-acetyltransferase [Cellulomonas alba]|uniref:GNAT family N-acetyltransferase n=1 Tax=Cellulomonas alba TaxID=3053467 RepID=A0ABT7SEK3_9CELL|nr:GNAT family N-acetyltransferase [Cellulomonas alba]MDM7854621.1 GNAT family N-acetyltransferase [Cellulomonas alba]
MTTTADPTLEVALVGWDHPDAARLRTAQQRELRDRYGDDDIGHTMTGDGIVVFALLRVAGEPVACGAVRDVSDEHGTGTGEVKRMFVVPERRGEGHSRRVLAELERRAPEHGLTRLILETGTLQPEAIGLYLRAGYVPIDNFGEYAEVGDSRCFAKSLVPVERAPHAPRPTGTLTVERVEWDDADALALRRAMRDFNRATYEHFEPALEAAGGFEADDARIGAGVLATFVARLDGTPVGHAALRASGDGYAAGSGELKKLFVTDEARGVGAARALLAAVEAEARTLGLTSVVLQTGVRQPPAVALYVSAGYRAVVPFGPYVGDAHSLLFAKQL